MTSLIVPAAGLATRMKSDTPKTLIKIGTKSILIRIIERFRHVTDEVVLVIRPEQEKLFAKYLKLIDIRIKFVYQHNPNGTAEAVKLGLAESSCEVAIVIWGDHIGATFMSDFLISDGIGMARECIVVLPIIYRDNPYVYFKFSESMEIVSFHDTHKLDPEVAFGWSDCGVFFLNKGEFSEPLDNFLKENSNVQDINFLSAFPWLTSKAKSVKTLKANDERLTLGVNSASDLSLALSYFTK